MNSGGAAPNNGAQNSRTGRPVRGTLPLWGERVALHRVAKGLTQTELGDAVGVSRDTIARIERGNRRVSDELRVAFADLFDAAPEVLFPYAEVPGNARARTGRRRRVVTDDDVPTAAVA